MFDIEYPEDVVELIKRIGSNNIQKSFDAQLEFCRALQPIFNFDVFINKTIFDINLGIKLNSWIDWNKKYAKECRIDVILKGFSVLVDASRSKMEKYNTWYDCILVPLKDLPQDRFGIRAYILI